MLIQEIYERKHFAFNQEAKDWQEAIRLCCVPLEADGTVDATYAEEIIACVTKHGPYIVILPGLAMPHSTENSKGAHGTAIGFMKLENAVSFEAGNPDKDARVFFTLASIDPDAHVNNMQRLYAILTNEEVLNKLQEVTTPEEFLALDALLEDPEE